MMEVGGQGVGGGNYAHKMDRGKEKCYLYLADPICQHSQIRIGYC